MGMCHFDDKNLGVLWQKSIIKSITIMKYGSLVLIIMVTIFTKNLQKHLYNLNALLGVLYQQSHLVQTEHGNLPYQKSNGLYRIGNQSRWLLALAIFHLQQFFISL